MARFARPRSRSLARAAAVATTTVAVGATTLLGAGAASASSWQFQGASTVRVYESSSGVPVYLTFNGGEQARVTCSGSIWAGVWLTGNNGPDGWASSAPRHFPMPGTSGGRSFSAIARFTTGGATYAWQHAGTSAALAAPGWSTSQLELRTNDDAPGNGNGYFTCRVERWKLV